MSQELIHTISESRSDVSFFSVVCKSHYYLVNRFGHVGTSREIGGMIRDNKGHCNPEKSS